MSKRTENSFEVQIQEQLAISEAALKQAMKENMAIMAQYEESVESLHGVFSTPEED